MTTKLSAVCGCGKTLHTDQTLSPSDVIRWAQDHATNANHTVLFQGEVRVDKPKWHAKPTRKDVKA